MDFRVGDPIVHWIYGFGKILRLEERNLPGQAGLYYVVQVRDLTVWVPADEELANRLRSPTPERQFDELFTILDSPSETLPQDRLQRRMQLANELKEASAEANCRIVRDLSSRQQVSPLNDHDKVTLKRARESLLGEWTFSLSVPLVQAELELHRLLKHLPRIAVPS